MSWHPPPKFSIHGMASKCSFQHLIWLQMAIPHKLHPYTLLGSCWGLFWRPWLGALMVNGRVVLVVVGWRIGLSPSILPLARRWDNPQLPAIKERFSSSTGLAILASTFSSLPRKTGGVSYIGKIVDWKNSPRHLRAPTVKRQRE